MWRRSFSSKLLSHKSNPKSSLILYDILPPANSFFNHQYLYSSSLATPSSGDPIKLGFRKSDAIRSFAATALVGHETTSSLVFSKVSALLDSARHYGRCYWELSKARLSMLVVATSGTGYVLGSGSIIDFSGLCFTCAGTMMVAASANSLNQVFEVKNDARMKRTMNRPLPSGRITVPHAVTWASCVGIAGTALIACKANELAAGLAASNLILYAFVYTPLKQIHPVNTWVGAVVGAIPPLLGWAAASGQVSLNAMILPAALYFWQIPHFMALAYLCRDDYAAGGFKMFSLADATGKRTALVALRNCIYLVPLGFLAHDWGITTGWFSIESSILAAAISATAFSFYRKRTRQSARRMFHASLLYLPVFMSGLLFHRISDNHHSLKADRAEMIMVHPSSSDLILQEDENDYCQKKKPKLSRGNKGRPPVAYASVAPFPFLPAPSYAEF